MAGSPELAWPRRAVPWKALLAALTAALGGAVAAWAGGILRPGSMAVSVVGFVAGAGLIGLYWRRQSLGAANSVTLLRVVGTSWAAGLMCEALLGELSRSGQLLLIVIGTGCLVLDGVDGKVARGRGEVSAFGARFDMETDAALNLLLAITLASVSPLGWWVVLIGALRYLYVAASWMQPTLRTPLDHRYLRKVIAVAQAVALLASLLLDLVSGPVWLSTAIVGVALAALCGSFARDVVWQIKHR